MIFQFQPPFLLFVVKPQKRYFLTLSCANSNESRDKDFYRKIPTSKETLKIDLHLQLDSNRVCWHICLIQLFLTCHQGFGASKLFSQSSSKARAPILVAKQELQLCSLLWQINSTSSSSFSLKTVESHSPTPVPPFTPASAPAPKPCLPQSAVCEVTKKKAKINKFYWEVETSTQLRLIWWEHNRISVVYEWSKHQSRKTFLAVQQFNWIFRKVLSQTRNVFETKKGSKNIKKEEEVRNLV